MTKSIKDTILAIVNEEKWSKFQLSEYTVSRFTTLDSHITQINEADSDAEIIAMCKDVLKENEYNLSALYILAVLNSQVDNLDGQMQFQRLMNTFKERGKWGIVEFLTRRLLEFGDVNFALRTLIGCLKNLKKTDEIPELQERVAAIDSGDTANLVDVAENKEKSGDTASAARYYRMALNNYIHDQRQKQVEDIWFKLITLEPERLTLFYEIADQLKAQFDPEFMATLLQLLLPHYETANDWEKIIEILKHILSYVPQDKEVRVKLVESYSTLYSSHSHIEDFLRISGLKKWWADVFEAIETFENYIKFDIECYVFHRSWGVGKITAIEDTTFTIDFPKNEGHQMSFEMALSTLSILTDEHIKVYKRYKMDELEKMFKDDPISIIELIVKANPNEEVTIDEIKDEITDGLLTSKDWTKWWNKVKRLIKVNKHFQLKEKHVAYRQEAVSFADELITRFEEAQDFTSCLKIAIELLATDTGKQVAIAKYKQVTSYFKDQAVLNMKDHPGTVAESLVMMYRIYKHNKKAGEKTALQKLDEKLKNKELTSRAFGEIIDVDNKKLFFGEVLKVYKNKWVELSTPLCLTPLSKVHDSIVIHLIADNSVHELNTLIATLMEKYREYPDVFVWMSKNLLSESWQIKELEWDVELLFANLFYLVSHLNRQMKMLQESTVHQKLLKQIMTILFSKRRPFFKTYLIEHKKSGKDISKLWRIFTENKYIPSKYREQVFVAIRALEKTIFE